MEMLAYWSDAALLRGLEGEVYTILALTTSMEGEPLRPYTKPEVYAVCMTLIRISDMVDRLSEDVEALHPRVRWDEIATIGGGYALYPLSIDVEEMFAFIEEVMPDFYIQILAMIDMYADDEIC